MEDVFMEKAFLLAEEALLDNEVPVGCVFVHKGTEVGWGRNKVNRTKNPTHHAEMVAIKQMEKDITNLRSILSEMELFVTLEPCIMCACALYELGIKRIVYGAENDRFGGIKSVGCAEKYTYPPSIEITGLVQADRSIDMLKRFYEKENPFAPDDKKKSKTAKRQNVIENK